MAPPKDILKEDRAKAEVKAKVNAKRTPKSTRSRSNGTFPFTYLPFELQKEVFQYLLVASSDQTVRPDKLHTIENRACFELPTVPSWWMVSQGSAITTVARPSSWSKTNPKPLPCYHKQLETQTLTVSRNVNAVAVQVLYGCNRFHFSSASFFNKFTDTISPMGVQSLRYLVIDYPLPRSFQVASLRRLVMGTEVLDLQTLELNMLNKNKERMTFKYGGGSWISHEGPSASAEMFIDLLEGLKETQSVGNNVILFAINEKFDVNKSEVREQLMEVAELMDGTGPGLNTNLPEYCKVKLTRKTK